MRSVPDILIVEAVTGCPNECRDCPAGERLVQPNSLSSLRFQEVMEEIHRSDEKPKVVRFTGWGEAIMWPYLIMGIRQARHAGIDNVGLITSGRQTDRVAPRRLFDAGLTEVEISIDAATRKRYAEGRRRTMDRALQGLEAFVAAKPADATLTVSMVDRWPETDEAEKFREAYAGAVVRQHLKLTDGQLDAGCQGDRWACPQLWQRLTLSVSGKWRYCCSDWLDATALPDQSLRIAWGQSILPVYRALHEQKAFHDVPVCRDCKIWCTNRWDEKSYAAHMNRNVT